MGLYLENGYLDVYKIIEMPQPFVFCVGGRGTGKTFGALKECKERFPGRFQFMRRTQTELDNVANNINSPFKALNQAFDWDVTIKPAKNYAIIKEGDEVIGTMVALSTVANIRGFDASDTELIIYDEFIPESHKTAIKNEHTAFLNYYETVNRNRELQGKPPVKIRCFSNSNDILNPLIVGLELVSAFDKMRKKKQEVFIDNARGMALIDLQQSPISARKGNTALYKFAGEGDFYSMAIGNKFISPLTEPVSRPIREYRPLLHVGEICIYQHKSNGRFYVTQKISGAPRRITLKDADLRYMRMKYEYLIYRYFSGLIDFEETLCEILFLKYFDIKL